MLSTKVLINPDGEDGTGLKRPPEIGSGSEEDAEEDVGQVAPKDDTKTVTLAVSISGSVGCIALLTWCCCKRRERR